LRREHPLLKGFSPLFYLPPDPTLLTLVNVIIRLLLYWFASFGLTFSFLLTLFSRLRLLLFYYCGLARRTPTYVLITPLIILWLAQDHSAFSAFLECNLQENASDHPYFHATVSLLLRQIAGEKED
jgi:hypothetical protein